MFFKVIAYLFSFAMAISGYFMVYATNNVVMQMRGMASILLGIFFAILVAMEHIENKSFNENDKESDR